MEKYLSIRKKAVASAQRVGKSLDDSSDASRDSESPVLRKDGFDKTSLESVPDRPKARPIRRAAEEKLTGKDETRPALKATPLSRPKQETPREAKSKTAVKKKEETPKTMTLLQFKANAALNRERQQAINSFGKSVDELIRSPQKIKESPFYDQMKSSLTTSQATSMIRTGRRRLFADEPTDDVIETEKPQSPVKAAPDREIYEPPTSSSIPTVPRTPVKNALSTPVKNAGITLSPVPMSPGKRTLFYSPIKGVTHEFVKSAAEIHRDHSTKDVDPDGGMEVSPGAGKLQLGKRKATFDREEFKKRMEKIKTAQTLVDAARSNRLETIPPETDFHVTAEPAYEKYRHLVTGELPLPPIYTKLEKIFDELEMTVKLMNGQTCFFDKLKQVFMDRIKHNLIYDDLGRIKAYFPLSYIFRIEKLPFSTLAASLSNGSQTSRDQLAVFLCDDTKESEPTFLQKLEIVDQVRRKKKFHKLLLDEVTKFHQEYLSSLGIVLPSGPIFRWHSKFLEDYEFKLKEPVSLPQPTQVAEPVSAEEVLRRNNPDMSDRVKKALEDLKKKKEALLSPSKSSVPAHLKSQIDVKQWNLLSPALRKRAEENAAKNAARLVTRDPVTTRKLRVLERLPEMSGIVWSYFKSEKMLPRTEQDIVKAVRMSLKAVLSEDEAKEHMALFVELFDGVFMSRYQSHNQHYWKLKDEFNVKDVRTAIEDEIKRLRTL